MAQNQYAAYQQPSPYDQRILYRQADPYAQVQTSSQPQGYSLNQVQHPYQGYVRPNQPWLNGQPPVVATAPTQYVQYADPNGPLSPQRPSPTSPFANHYQLASPGTPTSPVRRPLPDPHSARRPDGQPSSNPSRGSTPQPLPTPAPGTPSTTRFVSHHASASVPVSSAFMRQISNGSPDRLQQRPGLPSPPPRPLPNPIPRSVGQLDLNGPRSASPTRRMLPGPPLQIEGGNIPQPQFTRNTNDGTDAREVNAVSQPSTPGQKFVPLWKRALPAPAPVASSSTTTDNVSSQMQGILERRGIIPPGSSNGPIDGLPSVAVNGNSTTSSMRHAGGNSMVRPLPSPGMHARSGSNPRNEVQPVQTHPSPRAPFVLRERSRTLPSPTAAPTYPPPTTPLSQPTPSPPLPLHEEPESISDDDDFASNTLLSRRDDQPTLNGRTTDAERTDVPAARTPSPQYGIRDLPSRSAGNAHHRENSLTQQSSRAEEVASSRPNITANAQSQSVALRMAALSLRGPADPVDLRSQPNPNSKTQATPVAQSRVQATRQWPPELPALPKAPGSGFTQASPRPLPVRMQSLQQRAEPPRTPSLPQSNGSGPYSRVRQIATIDLDDAPPPSLRRSPAPPSSPGPSRSPVTSPTATSFARNNSSSAASSISLSMFPDPPRTRKQVLPDPPGGSSIPKISLPDDSDDDDDDDDDSNGPIISIMGPDSNNNVPSISVGMAEHSSRDRSLPSKPDNVGLPTFSFGDEDEATPPRASPREVSALPTIRKGTGLTCGGCGGAIIGRIVSAMGARWHPGCFRCCVCDEILENLSSYEHDGRPYCHLDYHERFAPRCFHCETAIVDEQFITLDDAELGKRTYHEQHFFCAECGDPFLAPRLPGDPRKRNFEGDGTFQGDDDDVGFTVYKGYPYCEPCHVRLRMPKCKKCKKSIRDRTRAVEALGGKWCWQCFTCAACEQPFEDPSFFQRNDKPYCERCFSIMIKSEIML